MLSREKRSRAIANRVALQTPTSTNKQARKWLCATSLWRVSRMPKDGDARQFMIPKSDKDRSIFCWYIAMTLHRRQASVKSIVPRKFSAYRGLFAQINFGSINFSATPICKALQKGAARCEVFIKFNCGIVLRAMENPSKTKLFIRREPQKR